MSRSTGAGSDTDLRFRDVASELACLVQKVGKLLCFSSGLIDAANLDRERLVIPLFQFLTSLLIEECSVYAAPGSRTSTPGLCDAMRMAS